MDEANGGRNRGRGEKKEDRGDCLAVDGGAEEGKEEMEWSGAGGQVGGTGEGVEDWVT